MKGLSPLLATIFVIAFTVGVAGILSVWLTGFATTQTQTVGSSGEKLSKCASSVIEVSSVRIYCGIIPSLISNVSYANVTVRNKAGSEILYNVTLTFISKGLQNRTTPSSNTLLPGDSISLALQNINSTGNVLIPCPFDIVRAVGLCQNTTTIADECKFGESCFVQTS